MVDDDYRRSIPVTELARAKVNLTLDVLGRRPDGYHELATLIAFADVGDRLAFERGGASAVTVGGAFAGEISGENLVARTLELLAREEPRLILGAVTLVKELPVAAGLGGGSADAAAVLRAVRAVNPAHATAVDWQALAAKLGADVPVCLASQAAWVGGYGEEIAPLDEPLPPLAVVLANPRVPVPADKTAQVFRWLAAPPLASGAKEARPRPPRLRNQGDLIAFMHAHGNALEAPARKIVPAIGDVLAALAELPGAEVTRLSGAGPTCFAAFADDDAARAAAARLADLRPGWWVRATRVR